MRSKGIRLLALTVAICLGLPPSALARVQPSSGFDLFSADQEIQVGKQAAADTNKQLPVLPDSDPIVQYVQQLGAKLVAHAPGQKWPYNFHVVNQKEINAFALPGGPIYINMGTIQAAENESELAGVMAHEMSHVIQRHATRAATKQMEAQVPLAILGGFLGRGIAGQLAALGIQFGVGSYFLKNSRQAEREADLLGTDIMYDTGYDPHAMPQFFEIIKQKYPSRSPQFLSDHPDPGNRIEYVSNEIKTLPPKQYLQSSPQFAQAKQRALGMKPLSAQEIAQQQKQNPGSAGSGGSSGIAPSGNFRQLQHNAFTISYPDNWQVAGDANSAVTIAPQAGVSQDAIAYGAIINGFQPESANSLDSATHELIAQLRQSNPDLKQVGSDQDIKVNGVPAKSVDMVGTSPIKDQQGRAQRERDWLVALPMSDRQHVLYAVFIAPDNDFHQLRPAFENMLRSLHVK
jgi:Zn-dependent protease with chaperone function